MWDRLEPRIVTSLVDVPVRLGWVPFSMGEYWFETGTIYIPVFSLYRTAEGPYSLVGTLIHEFGHALGEALRERHEHFLTEFSLAFCRRYSVYNHVPYRACSHVNEYAASSGLEDFAETYTSLVCGGGLIDAEQPKSIQRKLRFVQAWARA